MSTRHRLAALVQVAAFLTLASCTTSSTTTSPDATQGSTTLAVPSVMCTEVSRSGCTALGLTLAEPVPLHRADAVVLSFGGTFVGAWRTDWLCVDARELGMPDPHALRFAFREVQRVVDLRDHLNTLALPGHHVPYGWMSRNWLAASALSEPGVLVEGLEILVPSERIAMIEADERFRVVVPLLLRAI